jgi:hypothetical protein
MPNLESLDSELTLDNLDLELKTTFNILKEANISSNEDLKTFLNDNYFLEKNKNKNEYNVLILIKLSEPTDKLLNYITTNLGSNAKKVSKFITSKDICPYIKTLNVGEDVYTLAKELGLILIPLSIAGTIAIPITTSFLLIFSGLITKYGVSFICP